MYFTSMLVCEMKKTAIELLRNLESKPVLEYTTSITCFDASSTDVLLYALRY